MHIATSKPFRLVSERNIFPLVVGVNNNLYGRPMSPQLFEGYAHKMLWIHGLSWNTLKTMLRRMLQCKDDTTYFDVSPLLH